MPFSIQVEGMNELIRSMEKLPEKAAKVAAEALYEGAGVVADKVSSAVQGIATEPFKYAAGGRRRKPSPEEKAIVAGAKHGVAKFRKTGVSVQTSVGYQNAGYASLNGKTKPVPLIANSINLLMAVLITIGSLMAIGFAVFLITHKKMSVYAD